MTSRKFVDHIEDLISAEDYKADPEGRKVRIELRITAEGIVIVGDSQRAVALEKLLEVLGPKQIEQMLCG